MENLNAIIEGLNEAQKKAVQKTEGPVLIVAGAGSGKTRVLTTRIAYLLAKGVDPSRILALTFTKKAAGEMKERISRMVGGRKAWNIAMGTFHAIFVRFLREYAESLGYPAQFTIYDTSAQQSAVKACVKELGLDDTAYKPKDVLSRISMLKNNLYTVNGYRNNSELAIQDSRAKRPRFGDVYELYQKKLKLSGAMDFDDILMEMNILLKINPEALDSISGRFDYIMVDEYQDTNYAQYVILKKLAAGKRNICVVGDDSQSIYGFRGAKIENILNFRKDYPDSSIIRLEQNYRSTRTIVDSANSLIAKNENRIPKQCFSSAEEGEKIQLFEAYSAKAEAESVVSDIKDKMRTGGGEYRDFAILYRTNAQSREFEERLRVHNMPYTVYSGNAFFDRMEVNDVMAYFRLCVNVNDDEAFKRIVNKPARAIGNTSLSALMELARANGCTLFKSIWQENYEMYGLKPSAMEKIRKFGTMIDSLAARVHDTPAYEMATKIADESGIVAFYKSGTSIEDMSRAQNVDELLNAVAAFSDEQKESEEYQDCVCTLDRFIENVALLSNADTDSDPESDNRIALMTVHCAKGLEYSHVYIAGVEENIFPSAMSTSSLRDLEEERRLFYVAMTRAKKTLAISHALSRMRNGKTEENAPSRFLSEIDPKYLDSVPSTGCSFGRSDFGANRSSFGGASAPVRQSPASIHSDFRPSPTTSLEVGQRVEHNQFGNGTITAIDPSGEKRKLYVNFDMAGKKVFFLDHAKLRILSKS